MGSADDIEKGLAEWAESKLHRGVRIANIARLSGGASQETWAFDAIHGDNVRKLILRRAQGGGEGRNAEALPLATEAKLLKLANVHKVPTPEVVGVFAPGSQIGEAFIMQRIEGETIARKILRDAEFTTARNNLTKHTAKALAELHKIPLEPLPDLPLSNGLDQLAKYEATFRALGQNRPVFELAMAWLKANPPRSRSSVLVHGDYRLGNFIVNSSGLASVLDWELAHIGDPREDIAWLCVNSWRFGLSEKRVGGYGHLDAFLDAYHRAGGDWIDASEIDWWEVLGSFKWGVMCMIMYESFRTGADASVERAAIGRRVSETEIDLVNLLESVAAHE